MTYKENDNLANLKAGDTLVMDDGSAHEAVGYLKYNKCDRCSVGNYDSCCKTLRCVTNEIHFKQLTP